MVRVNINEIMSSNKRKWITTADILYYRLFLREKLALPQTLHAPLPPFLISYLHCSQPGRGVGADNKLCSRTEPRPVWPDSRRDNWLAAYLCAVSLALQRRWQWVYQLLAFFELRAGYLPVEYLAIYIFTLNLIAKTAYGCHAFTSFYRAFQNVKDNCWCDSRNTY